jgi:hypothetical protein
MTRAPFIVIDGKLYRWKDILELRRAQLAAAGAAQASQLALFATSELPGRKVGRKWITTKAAVLRWIENTSGDDSLARAVERGDMGALTRAMNKGKVRVSPKGE